MRLACEKHGVCPLLVGLIRSAKVQVGFGGPGGAVEQVDRLTHLSYEVLSLFSVNQGPLT